MNASEISIGDTIKDVCGDWYAVKFIDGNFVYVGTGKKAIHISRIVEVKKEIVSHERGV